MTDKTDLSPRDLEIASLAAGGVSTREIAERLFITTNTVKYHLKRAYDALKVHNRAQLANSLHSYENYPRVGNLHSGVNMMVRFSISSPSLGA
jgi:DNA-binding CsgD family transcriptional regulator